MSPPWPFSFFLPCLWRTGDGCLPTSRLFALAHKVPLPLSPTGSKGRGGGKGGQGSPSVQRLHRVFRLNQEIFYYQKKKKEKKIPAATFPPCPIGTDETGSVGFPRRVAQGWNTLRQEWWSSLAGPPPGPLWASPLSSPSSPPSKPPEVAFSCPQVPGLRAWGQGPGGGAVQPWGGWGCGRGPWPPSHCIPALPSPELGISFHKLLWGRLFPSSKVCAIFSWPSRPPEGPIRAGGEGAAGHMGSSAHGAPGTRMPGPSAPLWESLCLNAQPPCRPLPRRFPFVGINLGTSSLRSSDFPHHSHLSALPFLPDAVAPPLRRLPRASRPPGGRLDWAAGPGASAPHRVGDRWMK